MKVRSGLLLLMVAAFSGAVLPAFARQQETSAGLPHMRAIPPSKAPAPFAIDSPRTAQQFAVEFRSAGRMTQSDKLLAANYESSIAEAAARQGFDLGDGRWSYRQIVCPALPAHLFLRYTRNAGAGDLSVFSASVLRGAEGRVRIVPILKRSYSLFSPAPINALTLSAFNHIREEEPVPQRTQGWLGNGLCYAALAGGNPQVLASEGTLTLTGDGGQVIRFTDTASSTKSKIWTMTFAPSGRLVRAALEHAPANAELPIPAMVALAARPVPQTQQSTAKPVPSGQPLKWQMAPGANRRAIEDTPRPAGRSRTQNLACPEG